MLMSLCATWKGTSSSRATSFSANIAMQHMNASTRAGHTPAPTARSVVHRFETTLLNRWGVPLSDSVAAQVATKGKESAKR